MITGLGLISPLGSNPTDFWAAIALGTSGIALTTLLPADRQPLKYAGEAKQFTGEIDDFGPLEGDRKKAIKKGLKVMCRETRMAVAAAQLALVDAGITGSPMTTSRSIPKCPASSSAATTCSPCPRTTKPA